MTSLLVKSREVVYLKMNRKRSIISMSNAKEIYDDLILRIKSKVKSEISVVFDDTTGIQKAFLKGKLLWTKKVRLDK